MTAHPTVNEQVGAVVGLVQRVLGPAIVGVYLHGSAVMGGLRSRSDLDVLVVTIRSTTHDEKQDLVAGLFAVSNRDDLPGFDRPVELTVVVAAEVRPWRFPAPIDFLYGEWLRGEFVRGELDPAAPTNPDLATVLTVVRRHGLALVGPPPASVLDPVPRTDLILATSHELEPLLANLPTDTRNVVLTLARMWLTLATGEIRTKDAAARWALDRLPPGHRPVLARARAIYLDEEPEGWDDLRARIEPHAAHVAAEIRRLQETPQT